MNTEGVTGKGKYHILQPILFPDLSVNGEERLYYKPKEGGMIAGKDPLKMDIQAEIVFSTYFNLFSCRKWKQYSDIKRVGVVLGWKGTIEISIYHTRLIQNKVQKTLIRKEVKSEDFPTYDYLEIGEIPDNGAYYFSIKAIEKSVFYGGYYAGEKSELLESEKTVKLAVAFTTYKRERYITQNIHRMQKVFGKDIDIYVADNGNSLEIAPSEGLTVMGNKNTGGAGGFARCMLEIRKNLPEKRYTHFILMDDDVVLDARLLRRLKYFLMHLKEEYADAFVGGAMLRSDLPFYQVESGAKRMGNLIWGYGNGLDMRKLKNCLANELIGNSQYNAWWFTCIPVSYLRADNLPLPLFFQWDDVDYGIRNRAHVILLNGICTWHDAFEAKRSLMYTYYSTRNPLIVDSSHEGKMPTKSIVKYFDKLVRTEIYMYRYENVRMICRAIEDYLKGASWLMELDQESYNQEILSCNRKQEKITDLDYTWYQVCRQIKDCDLLHAIVRRLSLNGYLLKANRFIVTENTSDQPVQAYRATEILYYNEFSGLGYFCKRNRKSAWKCFWRYRRIRARLKRDYEKISAGYAKSYPYLTSEEYWRKLLHYEG